MTANDSILELRADLAAVRALGPWIRECLEATESHALVDRAGAIELALQEVAVNVIEHSLDADGCFEIHFAWSPGTQTASFASIDHGPPVDVERLPGAPETPQVGGYGLMIVEQLADAFGYTRLDDDVNEWLLTFAASE